MTKKREFIPVNIAIMTVSDTRTAFDDKSGALLISRLQEAGHNLVDKLIVPDEKLEIMEKLRSWIENPSIDVIISTGGTGLTGRDVSVEAQREVYEKEIDAFNVVFTSAADQSINL